MAALAARYTGSTPANLRDRPHHHPTRLAAAIILVSGATFQIVPGQAEEQASLFTFRQIYDNCLNGSELCLGYVVGTGEMMAIAGASPGPPSKWALCSGNSIPPASAMVRAVLNFGQAHPESWGAPSAAAVAVALQQAWPCR